MSVWYVCILREMDTELLEESRSPLALQGLSSQQRSCDCIQNVENDLCNASLGSIQDGVPFEVETDASDFALVAVLSQDGRPVAFMSRTLSACEKRYSAVEKEATAIIEAVRIWLHFLEGRHFTIVTDQESVSFMFSQTNRGKIKC